MKMRELPYRYVATFRNCGSMSMRLFSIAITYYAQLSMYYGHFKTLKNIFAVNDVVLGTSDSCIVITE